MKLLRWSSLFLSALAAACSSSQNAVEDASKTPQLVTPPAEPAPLPEIPGGVQRVGGDMEAKVEKLPGRGVDGADVYVFGDCNVTTALPEGYPAPTPPGAIEIKLYPRARRAEVTGNTNPDLGMFFGFWPLFQHIKRNEIAMTSPVELDYRGFNDRGRVSTQGWTMSFLYREPEMGAVGNDGDVAITDRSPVVVISQGKKGPYFFDRADTTAQELVKWVEASAEWEVAGAPRALYYNGPDQDNSDKWSEIQVPIRKRAK